MIVLARRRLALLLIVIAGLLPVWVRWPKPTEPASQPQVLSMTPLRLPAADLGELRALGAWRLQSPNSQFGSYSALVALDDGMLLAASDSGRRLRFTPPGRRGPGPKFDYFAAPEFGAKLTADIEALTRDPVTGRVWAAFEYGNRIERFGRAFELEGSVRPVAMRRWRSNSGPEAMVRLADGRFVVLAEANPRWFAADVPAVLFAGDPVDGAKAIAFRYRPPAGFRPVDMALLPSGKVLILLREVLWGVPPRFAGKLVLAEPAAIRAGGTWRGEVIADLRAPLPSDNFEGLAVEPAPGGGVTLWLISDDNNVTFQDTLLLKLEWANEKARGASRAPR